MMRIYGNRRIVTIPGDQVRPTPARVREAIFNIWGDRLLDAHWLDLCSGNGTMGAEALCRGVARVVGVEKWGRACGVIRQNWQGLAQVEQCFEILRGDVVQVLPKLAGQGFDLIYFDPPYGAGLYNPVLAALMSHGLLRVGGALAVEHDPKQWRPEQFQAWGCDRTKVYGNTAIAFYRP